MQIKIVFDTGYELIVELFDTDFVKRWCKLLQHELECNTLSQEDTFSNFIPESLARQRLEQSISTVNKFLRREFISIPQVSDYNNHEFYNQLHEKFEKLAGPDWDNPTKLMVVAPDNIKLAIRHINRYCHRLEKRPYVIEPEMRIEFNTHIREPLREEDYKLFNAIKNDHVVVLDYSTLGKSLFECYEDGLTPDYAGLKIQQHYSANFILKFGETTKLKPAAGFKKWLNDHNITDPTPGHIQLGKFSDKTAFDKIKQSAKIVTIHLE
jgi:hypothetical protein